MRHLLVVCILLTITAVAPGHTIASDYIRQYLERLDGDYWSQSATGLNDSGVVVGYCEGYNATHSFMWSNGITSEIRTPTGYTDIRVYGINNNSRVIGTAAKYQTDPDKKPFVFYNNRYYFLTQLSGYSDYRLNDISNTNSIIGSAFASGGRHAILWQNGSAKDLGTLHGGTSTAYAINDKDQVVGVSDNSIFLWQNGQMQEIGVPTGYSGIASLDINNTGQIVGTCYNMQGQYGGFLWQDGVMQELNHKVACINDRGEMAVNNFYTDSQGTPCACAPEIWTTSGQKLCTLPFPNVWGGGVSAKCINNNGWVLGNFWSGSGSGILWTPVPEPSCFAALLFGVSALGITALRRR